MFNYFKKTEQHRPVVIWEVFVLSNSGQRRYRRERVSIALSAVYSVNSHKKIYQNEVIEYGCVRWKQKPVQASPTTTQIMSTALSCSKSRPETRECYSYNNITEFIRYSDAVRYFFFSIDTNIGISKVNNLYFYTHNKMFLYIYYFVLFLYAIKIYIINRKIHKNNI